jgi:ribonuclease P protein component
MRRSSDFGSTIRRGRRGVTATVVVHSAPATGLLSTSIVGFVVSRAVGSAVVRNRVKRRLRHLVREEWDAIAPGTRLVVRATPEAGAASYHRLGTDLRLALDRAKG